jgi:uncharacterized membrane protein
LFWGALNKTTYICMENNLPPEQNQTPAPATTEAAEQASSFTINEQTVMAALSYLGILILIPFFVKKEDPFVHYHIKQGVVLLIPELILYVVSGMMYFLWPVWNIIWLIILGFTIVGVINCLTKKEKPLPFIGQYASKVNI